MTPPTRLRWLHPLTIVCGLILASEAAVVGYESCAGRPSESREPEVSSPPVTAPFVTAEPPEPTRPRPAAPARTERVVAESPGVPRALQQPSQPTMTAPVLPPPETPDASALAASAARTVNNEMANALRSRISKLEAELRSGDAGDLEEKQKMLVQARSSLTRLEAGADGPIPAGAATGDSDAGAR